MSQNREPVPARGASDSEGESGTLTKRQKRRRRKAASGPKPAARPGEAPAKPEGEGRAARPDTAKSARPSQKARRRKRRSGFAAKSAEGEPSAATAADASAARRAPGPVGRGTPPARDARGRASSDVGRARSGAAPSQGSASSDSRSADRPPVYAALDLGTNNCRLLMAVPSKPGQFRVIDAFSRIVRLGEGLGRTGSLSAGAMDRAVAALAICANKLAARDVRTARLIATEAARAAANGAEFIERVERDTGLSLEIVSRETEARLAVSGCGSLIDPGARGAVLFDIGGGSTEIALLDLRNGPSRRLGNQITAWTSLPTGVVTLAERYGGRNVTAEMFEQMTLDVVAMIERFPGRHKLDFLAGSPHFHLLGTSGTVTTLAGVHLDLERYDRRQVDGHWLASDDVDRLVATIAGWSFEERVANPCIGSDRADLVLAGCAILEGIRRVWPAPRLRVADRGLREGLLMEMMVADNAWRRTSRRMDR